MAAHLDELATGLRQENTDTVLFPPLLVIKFEQQETNSHTHTAFERRDDEEEEGLRSPVF